MEKITLRAIVFLEEGVWVAQCLEYDICAQAPDLKSLKERFSDTVGADLEESLRRHGKPFAGIGPGPVSIQAKWKDGDEQPFTSLGSATRGAGSDVDYEMALCA